jgi:aryl-alcohol dehydrogenase-like predicted oxidoreductase
MKYGYFGRTGIKVSEICLGTMTFGNEADEDASRAMMDRAFDAGVNFFDTADIYNQGRTEEIIGRWLPERREQIVLASKVYFPTGEGVNDRRSSRRHIVRGVERSLKRLQTDWLDVLYLHHWDDKTPIEESLSALTHLVDRGKVLYVGISNFAAWQAMKAVAVAREHGFAPIAVTQPMYNLLKRQAEVEILPMALSEGLAVCPYSPMGAGLLTGKYQRKESGRIDVNPMYQERYKDPVHREVSDRFVAHAAERGVAPAALSIAWVLSHPAITSAIIGARNLEQLEAALEATTISLTPEDRQEISALSPEPPLPTDRERAAIQPHPPKKATI